MSVRQFSAHASISDVSPAEQDIRAELGRLLESPEFRATPRRRDMLAYLVNEMLAGRGHELKGYTIGTAVFGRDEGFDPQADPVVRLEARRLRHDLDSYYVSEGRRNPLRISIPKGQYAPEIFRPETSSATATSNSLATAEQSATAGNHVAAAVPGNKEAASSGTQRLLVASIGVFAILAIIAGFGYWTLDHYRQGAKSEAFARGPAVMVLPFETYGNGADNSLGIGIADKIETELGRFPDMRLYIPKGSLAEVSPLNPIEEGEKAGVSYVVTGRIEKDNAQLRTSAKMIDVREARVLWSDSFASAMNAGMDLTVESEIAASIASKLGQPYGVIRTELTSKLAAEHFSPTISSYECVLRGYSYRRTFSDSLYAPVLACLKEAVRRDPGYAEAWAMLGWLNLDAGRFARTPDGNTQAAYDQALNAASHALVLDGKNVLALKALSSINHYMGNYDEAEKFARQALALNPNDPDSLAQLGWRLAVRGNFEEGIPYLQKAIERTVNPPGWYYHLIAIDHYMHGRYVEMLAAAKKGATGNSGISWSLIAIAYAELGKKDAAHEALARMAEISPNLTRNPGAVYRGHGTTEAIVEMVIAGLRKAGWSEPVAQ